MGLEALIERRKAGTPGTPRATAGVPEKPAQTLAGTPRTLGTPENDEAERVPAPDLGDWRGEVEQEPAPRAEPDWWRPKPLPEGSLVARLVASGATVRTYGAAASIEAPAGMPAKLVAEVERRGWRIIPGGKPNDEAEHDSWAFGGVPAADLDR
jgi:hypothetical protein